MIDKLYTVRQLAEHTGVSPASIRNAITSGEIPARRVRKGSPWLVSMEDFEAALNRWSNVPVDPIPPLPADSELRD